VLFHLAIQFQINTSKCNSSCEWSEQMFL